MKVRDDICSYAAMGSEEVLLSLAVTEGIGYGPGWHYKIDSIDIQRAYFVVPAKRNIHIELPMEDFEEGMCGKLRKSMYGTRYVAQNWDMEYDGFMKSLGFRQGRGASCVFCHEERELRLVVHGDDFTVLGPVQGLEWFRNAVG